MIVTKSINNNIAICRDGNGRELIAFGKGIGFPSMPYELTDMNKVDRTFYNVSGQYLSLLKDIPGDVIAFTAEMMDDIIGRLPYEITPNITLVLADHIAFALERAKKGIYIRMPSVYEMEQSYPLEVRIGRRFCSAMERQFHIKVPRDEVQCIALHFINARTGESNTPQTQEDKLHKDFEELLEQTTQIIEWELGIHIRKDTFSYARFASHLEYLSKRLFEQQYENTDNMQVYRSFKEEYPDVARCVDKIGEYYQNKWSATMSEEEKLYLIMHINRICAKENP